MAYLMTANFLNTIDFFNVETFSDITLVYGFAPTRRMPCHKIILASRSRYFKSKLGAGSKPEVKDMDKIELDDDNATAVDAMLHYIYQFEYADKYDEDNSWHLHLSVAKIGKKYGIPDLEAKAFQNFQHVATRESDARDVMDVIGELQKFKSDDGKSQSMIDTLREKNFANLMKYESTRLKKLIKGDRDLIWNYLQRLAFANDLVEKEMLVCSICSTEKTGDPGTLEKQCRYCQNTDAVEVKKCWVKRE